MDLFNKYLCNYLKYLLYVNCKKLKNFFICFIDVFYLRRILEIIIKIFIFIVFNKFFFSIILKRFIYLFFFYIYKILWI